MKHIINQTKAPAIIGMVLFMFNFSAWSNNIQVSNISLTGQNIGNQTVIVQFDVSWDNSWRISSGPANWDAAWIFVKFRRNSGSWGHANINIASLEVAGGTLEVTSDEVGATLYRDSDGTGNVSFTGVQLQWDYGENGVTNVDVLDVLVFALEMVYVPGGSFFVGDSDPTTNSKFFSVLFGMARPPSLVFSEAPITIQNVFGSLYYFNDSGFAGDQTGTLPVDFPKGFDAFYCMKYEATEGQWVDFFNTLDATMKTNHDLTDINHKNSDNEMFRNTISWPIAATNAITSAPDRALNFTDEDNMSAYLDWSGLRPMTELEFEKACRGPLTPVPREYAWGNSGLNTVDYEPANNGTPNETITNMPENIGNALMGLNLINFGVGPIRVGIFAASAVNPTREETGGSYYGIMELNGNLNERCVTVGTPGGRSFTGLHGDGRLAPITGAADVANWPTSINSAYGRRGGGYSTSNPTSLRVSDRILAGIPADVPTINGVRGVRNQ